MPRPCSICTHPDRATIDAEIRAGTPNRRIASKCDVSEAAVRRHRKHLGAAHAPGEASEPQKAATSGTADESKRIPRWTIPEQERKGDAPVSMRRLAPGIVRPAAGALGSNSGDRQRAARLRGCEGGSDQPLPVVGGRRLSGGLRGSPGRCGRRAGGGGMAASRRGCREACGVAPRQTRRCGPGV
jgi:hypothetical protein